MMRLAIALGGVALALSSCDWMDRADRPPKLDSAKARSEEVRRSCASQLTYARLKEYVFDEAARIRASDPRRLDSLAAQSVVRMDEPLVKSRDDELNVTVCTGRFVLDLPPGIQDAFNGRAFIAANVEYAAQDAADGSGLVYSMSGAEPIIYRIATLGLPTRPMPPIAQAREISAAGTKVPEMHDLAEARTQAQPETLPAAPKPRKATVAAPQGRPEGRAESEAMWEAKTTASPSFNCRRARTPSERTVCGSSSLAAADRRMAAVYYSEMANAKADAKRELRRTRDEFLARRERCSSESCVAVAYEKRVAEIRRIVRR